MHILFMGGTGNISQDCALLLAERGHRVSVLTRGRRPLLPEMHALTADRHDADAIRRAVSDSWPEVVINFLGFTPGDVELDHAVFSGHIRQYLYISSATVYAKPNRCLPLTEDSPRGNPFSPYAQQKQACEDWLMEKFRRERFPVTIIRPSHTYSRRWIPNPVKSDNYTLAARMENRQPVFVHGDGQGLWTLTATTDFAVGLAGLTGRTDAAGECFHITSDEVLTWNQIYAEIARAAGVNDPEILRVPVWFICRQRPETIASLPGDKAENAVFDNAKIKRWVPAFSCRKCFRDGITEAVRWYGEDPARRRVDPAIDEIFETVCAAWKERGV